MITKKTAVFFWIALFLTAVVPFTSGLASAQDAIYTNQAKSLGEFKDTLPNRIRLTDVVLKDQESVDLDLIRYEAFSPKSSFLLGDSSGAIRRKPLEPTNYYRGSVHGIKGSFAFLSIDKASGAIRGHVEITDSFRQLVQSAPGQKLVASKAASQIMRCPLSMSGIMKFLFNCLYPQIFVLRSRLSKKSA